jgi:hypothetical protein
MVASVSALTCAALRATGAGLSESTPIPYCVGTMYSYGVHSDRETHGPIEHARAFVVQGHALRWAQPTAPLALAVILYITGRPAIPEHSLKQPSRRGTRRYLLHAPLDACYDFAVGRGRLGWVGKLRHSNAHYGYQVATSSNGARPWSPYRGYHWRCG